MPGGCLYSCWYTGLLFHYQSIEALVFLYRNTGVSGFIEWRINNSHLLIRLGDVWGWPDHLDHPHLEETCLRSFLRSDQKR